MNKAYEKQWEFIRNISAVIIIHLSGAYIVTRYLTNHTQTKSLAVTTFGLMVLLYFLSSEETTVNILRKIIIYTKNQFTQKNNLKKVLKNTLTASLMSMILFGLLKTGAYVNLYTIPQEHLHTVSFMYILVSVPVQQLLFFILPARITKDKINPLILSAITIVFFGTIHGYYPDFITMVLASVALGIPSAFLVFYKHDYYATIFNHMIAGSIALSMGLV